MVQTVVQRLTGLTDKNQESPNDLMGRCFKLEFICLYDKGELISRFGKV